MYGLRCFIQHRLKFEATGERLLKLARIKRPRRFLTTQVEQNATKTAEESPKSWRENPNLKYWVIGVGAITGVIYRYVYKEKDKKKIIVKNFPSLPSHKLQSRDTDLNELYNLYKNSRSSSVSTVFIEGYHGSGKTLMAAALAEKLTKEEEGKYHFLPRNLFAGTINAANLNTLLFDIKKFAVAVGCQSKDWLLRIDEGVKFGNLSDGEQLRVIANALQEKLSDNPNWILIFDNLNDSELLHEVFGDDLSSWGKGTLIVTTGTNHNAEHSPSYCLDKG